MTNLGQKSSSSTDVHEVTGMWILADSVPLRLLWNTDT